MNDKNKKISGLEDFFDNDPTDELPTLTDQAAPDHIEEVDDDTGQVPMLAVAEAPAGLNGAPAPDAQPLSLLRLEGEIKALQAKWLGIETDLRERDAEIARLETELAARNADHLELEEQLAGVRAERDVTVAEIDTLRSTLEERARQLEDRDTTLEELRATVTTLQQELAAANEKNTTQDREIGAMRADLEQRISAASNRDQRVLAVFGENARLRLTLDELTQYVDRRKAHWDDLQAEFRRQRDSIDALEKAVASKEAQLQRQALEQEVQETRMRELEERCDGLIAARSQAADEREAFENTAASLREALESERDQVSSLQAELQAIAARAGDAERANEALDEERQRRDELTAELDGLRQMLAERDDELAQRDEQLADLTEVRVELDRLSAGFEESREMLAERDAAIDELRESSEQNEAEFELAKSELLSIAQQRDHLKEKLAARESRTEQLEARVTTLNDETQRLQQDVTRQADIIDGLEAELRKKLQTIEKLSRHSKRVAALESNIMALDARMSDPVGGLPEDDDATCLMVAFNGDRTIKYPLRKRTITIGRAPDSDIQIKRQYISRHHARIVNSDDGTVIEDLGSKNGILVNAERVRRHRLNNGDTVDIGQIQFRFVDLAGDLSGKHHA